jgi:hypothetical protein
LAIRQLGSFSLFELPDNSQEADDLLIQIEGHDVVVYLLDATKGLRSEDFQWIARLRMGNASLMVILNKANLLLPNDLAKLVGDLKKKLSAPVLALNAANQEAVHEIFLPALLKVCPSLGATLAAEMGTLRQRVVNHYIQQAVMASSTLNAGNPETEGLVPLIDIQMKLVKQIAEIYGYKSHNPNELSLISLSSTFVQEFTQDIQQAVSGLGWMTGNFINAFSTWLVGQIAALYYDPDSFIWKRFGKEDV